jgi:hypothetical protein
MLLINKIRIGALLIAAWLTIGGWNRMVHPSLVIVPSQAPREEPSYGLSSHYPEVRTSTGSRLGGVA